MVRGAGKIAAGVLRTSRRARLSIARVHLPAPASVTAQEWISRAPVRTRALVQKTIVPVTPELRTNDAHPQWHLTLILF